MGQGHGEDGIGGTSEERAWAQTFIPGEKALGIAGTPECGTNETGSCQRKDHFICALRVADASRWGGAEKGGAEWCSAG